MEVGSSNLPFSMGTGMLASFSVRRYISMALLLKSAMKASLAALVSPDITKEARLET